MAFLCYMHVHLIHEGYVVHLRCVQHGLGVLKPLSCSADYIRVNLVELFSLRMVTKMTILILTQNSRLFIRSGAWRASRPVSTIAVLLRNDRPALTSIVGALQGLLKHLHL